MSLIMMTIMIVMIDHHLDLISDLGLSWISVELSLRFTNRLDSAVGIPRVYV